MLNTWYSLIVGILISLSVVIFLIFPLDDFKQPNWYNGVMLIIGVLGIIFGFVGLSRRGKTEIHGSIDNTETENIKDTEKSQ